jgi:hypothetical protein
MPGSAQTHASRFIRTGRPPGVRNYPNHQKFHSKGWAFEE